MMSCQESISDQSSFSECELDEDKQRSIKDHDDGTHSHYSTVSENSQNPPIGNHLKEPTEVAVGIDQLRFCKDSEAADENDNVPCKVQHFANCVIPNDEEENRPEDDLLYELLDFSDDKNCSIYKELHHDVCSDDWDEAVTGWKNVVPYANYSVTKKKPKKNTDSDKEDKSNGILCIKDDVDSTRIQNHSKSMWKANVESVTYRYIQNNGQYRLNKFCKEDRDWYTVRQKRAERVSHSLKTRYLQREIRRQLKIDFNKRVVHDDSHETDTDADQSNSEGKTTPSSSPLPCLVKSASDLYSENIPSRLNELDKEIRRDSQIRMSHEDPSKVPSASAVWGNPPPKSSTGSAHRAHSVHSSYLNNPASKSDNLRPLEKVTPQQRMKEDLVRASQRQAKMAVVGETSPSELKVKSAIEITNLDLERLRIMPLEETSRRYFGQILRERQESSSFLRATKMHLSSAGSKTSSGPVISAIGMDSTDSRRGVGDSTQSVQTQKAEHSLPGVNGQRITVPLSNFRIL